MKRKSANIWQKAPRVLWHQKSMIAYALLMVLPGLGLLTHLYPHYSPLFFLSLSINHVNLFAYYSLLIFWLFAPLLLLIVAGLTTLAVGGYLGRRDPDLIKDTKKMLRSIPFTIAGLWTTLFMAWMFSLSVKLLVSFVSIPFSRKIVCVILSYTLFYHIMLEVMRPFSFALHYHLIEETDWDQAVKKSCLLTKNQSFYIRKHDLLATLAYWLIPALTWLFSLLNQQPVHYVIGNTLTRFGLLLFMSFIFAFTMVARGLIFKELKNRQD